MIYESYLSHHGIKGQKWGKQNGPPYPLDRKQQNKISAKYKRLSARANYSVTSYNSGSGLVVAARRQASKKTGIKGAGKTNQKAWQDAFAESYTDLIGRSYENSKAMKKAKALCDKYNMTSWDDLAKANEKILETWRKDGYRV